MSALTTQPVLEPSLVFAGTGVKAAVPEASASGVVAAFEGNGVAVAEPGQLLSPGAGFGTDQMRALRKGPFGAFTNTFVPISMWTSSCPSFG
jgi:hypothetical protein